MGFGDSLWLSDSAHTIGLILATKLVHCQTGNSRGHPLCSNSDQNKWLKPCRNYLDLKPLVCSHSCKIVESDYSSSSCLLACLFAWKSSVKSENKGYFTWRPIYIFMIISCWILCRMRNISGRSCRENKSTHFIFSNFFPDIVLFMK